MKKIKLCVFVGVCRHVHMSTSACRSWRRGRWIPLELELQALVSHLLWLPEAELLSCKSAVHSELPSHPPAPFCVCLCVHVWHVHEYASA